MVFIAPHYAFIPGVTQLSIKAITDPIIVMDDSSGQSIQREVTAIDIHEERVKKWYLEIALEHSKESAEERHAGYAALMLCTGFFEAHAQYLYGKDTNKKSMESFTKAFKEFLRFCSTSDKNDDSFNEEIAKAFYKKIRCGLFHSATATDVLLTVEKIFLRVYQDQAKDHITGLALNKSIFVKAVNDYFADYTRRLREFQTHEYDDLREKFVKGWNMGHK